MLKRGILAWLQDPILSDSYDPVTGWHHEIVKISGLGYCLDTDSVHVKTECSCTNNSWPKVAGGLPFFGQFLESVA